MLNPTLQIPKWEVFLYDLNGNKVMDVSSFCDFELRLLLNDNSYMSASMDLVQFEEKCLENGLFPRNVLYALMTEVKVYRNGIAKFGGIVAETKSVLGETEKSLTFTADSYLQHFATRRLTKNYYQVGRSEIAADAIITAQSVPNGDIGITIGTLAETFASDLTADLRDIKSIIQLYTYARPVTYDFEITPEKVFNTYLKLGSYRPQFPLTYPFNIESIGIPRRSSTLFNKVYGIGSGIGEERIGTVKEDAESSLRYRLKEDVKLYNSVTDQQTLEDNTEGYLQESKEMLVVPDVKVKGMAVDLDIVGVGDTLPLSVEGSSYNDDINGNFRIYGMTIKVDSQLFEDVSFDFYEPSAQEEQ